MRTLLPFIRLFKYAKWPLFAGIILMILGLASSVGLLTVSGWFLAATAIAGAGSLFNFFYPSATVRGLAIGRTVARYVEKIVTHDATFRILAKLRVQVFRKIIPLSPAVLDRYRHSDLLNRLVADVDTLDNLYLRVIAPFITAIVMIGILTFSLSLFDGQLALIIGITLLALLLIIPTIFYQLGKKFGEDLTEERAQYRTQFVEFIQAQAELLLFNAGKHCRKNMAETEEKWQAFQQKEANLSGLSTALVMFANGMLLAVVLWIAAKTDFAVHLAPDNRFYQASVIALFAFAALASFEILMPLGAAFLHIGQIVASAKRINELTEQQPLVVFDGDKVLSLPTKAPLLQIENVSFHYPSRKDFALQNIQLTFEQGKKIAILGKTGSGKSSLLQLLVRNYNPESGKILLGGAPIQDYTQDSLRATFCFLTQRVHVFSDTLRNNLQIASQTEISDEKMQAVLLKVGLDKLVAQEEGLDIWLGEGGRPLSGGEQRRLGLARILLNDAPILLLDEPTEGLDRETERHILSLVFEHCQDKTLIMVTHRLTDIEQFDQICVMDNAKVMECGSFDELYQQSGYFRQLLDRI